ncbi:MAG: serine/threonine-protein kinase [Polyangiaceae bacterium]
MLHLRPGEVFASDFRIERPLAMGGMGAVYVAEQLSTGRRRALKLMLPSLVDSPRTRERFEQEARVASQIASDHVVEVVAAGVDAASGAPWMAMELLDGETLSARIARSGPLPLAETWEVFRQLCHALGAAHAVGLVHRDIKPDNLYLAAPRREGIPFTLKILDFGIAKLTANVQSAGDATRAVGSPMWMAPEQTSAGAVQPSADVWALGLVAFHCLTGRCYWRAGNSESATLQELLREVVIDPLEPASQRAAALGVAHLLPPSFDDWFANAVARDPNARFPEANAAMAALGMALAPRDATSAPTPFHGGALPVAYGAAQGQSHGSLQGQPAVSAAPAAMSAPPMTASAPAAFSATRAPATSSSGRALLFALLAFGAVAVAIVIAVAGLGAGYYLSSESTPGASAVAPRSSAPRPDAGTQPAADATGEAAPTAAPDKTALPGPKRTGNSAAASTNTAATAQPKRVGMPGNYRPSGITCKKFTDSCAQCCTNGEAISPFPECACYFKPPATSRPAGAKPRGMTCAKAKDYCSVNCCLNGDFLSPFPECACYFLPPAAGVPAEPGGM